MILMGLPDVAHLTRVPLSTIRRWVSEGRLDKHGHRKPFRVDLEHAQRLADTREMLDKAP